MRLYEMFMGPFELTKPWQTSGVQGMRHFLDRAWRLVCDDDAVLIRGWSTSSRSGDVAPAAQDRRAVTEGIEGLRFNTSIARLMELVNALTPLDDGRAAS